MARTTEFTDKDFAAIKRSYAELLEIARARCASERELETVQKVFDFAEAAHRGVRRRSGEPYIIHDIEVAKIVVKEIGLGYKSICAALLHDIFDDTDIAAEEIRERFTDKIASLVIGLSRIKTVLDDEDSRKEGDAVNNDNFRSILLTLGGDVRVVLVKLADRLHNCRNIECIPEYKREKVLSETMNIFIPLAHRLGLYGVKSEMENIWLRFREPAAYNEITTKIGSVTKNKDRFLDDFLAPIRSRLDAYGIEYKVHRRIKTPYSIWYKINNKHVTFEQISDLYAVRIVFSPKSRDLEGERNECFEIFSLITSVYKYRPDRIRNWLLHPKQNGYEALHVTCIAADGTNVEVQIRTVRMDDIAEKGISAHWNYKRLQPECEESPMDKWLEGIRSVLQNSDVSTLDQLEVGRHDNPVSDIFVFDGEGHIHTLPKGATANSFASSAGSGVTGFAIAAKINHRLCDLSQVLASGDIVEIITTIEPVSKVK